MYTRSRQSQNYGQGGGTPQRGNQFQGQNFNQGTYQAANQNPQNAFKTGIPFKQQPQGQQRNIPQQTPKPVIPQQAQQQQQQPQQQQQQQQQQQPPPPPQPQQQQQIPQQQQQIPQLQQQIPQLQQQIPQLQQQIPQQQQQQPQQQQPNQQQLVNPQQNMQQQLVQQPQSTLQSQRLKPILKSSTPVVNQVQNNPQAQTPNPQMNQQIPQQNPLQQQSAQINQQNQNQLVTQNTPQNMEVSENGVEGAPNENNNGNQEGAVPRWKRRFPGKPNKKLKRLRMNQRLRKSIQPKNAVMALYEMKCGVQFTYPETQTILPNCPFIVHAHVDGKTFIGEGITKTLARQNAAECALKSQLLEKMSAAALKAATEAGGENQSNEEMKDGSESQTEVKQDADASIDESEMIPWGPLASFALYKLFSEWQNEGTIVPIPKPPGSILPMNKPKKEGVSKAASQKEVPPNAMYVHPVMLLNQLRPGLTFVETCRQGNPPNMMFTIAVEVDNKEYTGTAKNKKDAKKLAARAALRGCFGVNYPEDSNDAVMAEA